MIVRAKRNTNYTIMSNVGFEDDRLSLKAKGMLAYLLSKPDNWQVSDRQLAKIGPDGRAAVQAALKELETCGYLKRTRIRNEDGTFTWQSTIYDEPWFGYPATVQPATVEPAMENRAKISTVLVSTVEQVNDNDDNARARKLDGSVFKAWAENIPGTMTPILADKLNDLTDECGAPAVVYGIVASVQAGARNFNYIAKCARNHANGVERPQVRSGIMSNKKEGMPNGVHRQYSGASNSGGYDYSEAPVLDPEIVRRLDETRRRAEESRAGVQVPPMQGPEVYRAGLTRQ